MMTKHKDRIYDGVLHDLYACFLMGKAIPKELSDAFVERYLKAAPSAYDRLSLGQPRSYATARARSHWRASATS